MSKVKINQEITVTIILNESELRALDAMLGYGKEAFLSCFYSKCGTYYLKPHENGVNSLFDKLKKDTSTALQIIDSPLKRLW